MSRRRRLAAALVAVPAALAVVACSQEVIDAQARITDVEGPEGAQANGTNLLFAATFEPRVWAGDGTIPALGFSRRVDRDGDGTVDAADAVTRGPEATLIFPEELADFFCEPAPGEAARRCALRRSFPPGVYDWQWFFEHVPTGIVLQGPLNAASFTVPVPPPMGGGGDPPPPPPPPPEEEAPDETLALETRDPEGGETCVGEFPSQGVGDTGVTFRWHREGGVTGTALPGAYQIMVEAEDGPGCASLVVGSGGPLAGLLDLSNPLAAVATEICDVAPTNVNETAFRLEAGTAFRWRVRRHEADPDAGWTPWASFETEDFVAEPPQFVDPFGTNASWPEQGDELVVGPSGAGTVNIAWAPTGCPPHGDLWRLEKDGDEIAFTPGTLPSACVPPPGEPELCQRQVTVTGPGDYVFRLRHFSENGTLGSTQSVLGFSVAE